MDSLDDNRVFRFRIPRLSSTTLRASGVYLSGAFVS